MSRVDLNSIQAQLKVAIQRHQILVAKMKSDPQNVSVQKQLHEIQTEITSLSDRQKSIVQLLRKEIVNKQHTEQQSECTSALPTNTTNTVPAHSTPPTTQTPTNLSLGGSTVQLAPTNLSTKPCQDSNVNITPAYNAAVKARTNTIKAQMQAEQRSNSPPIRVPQYTIHRPSILQGRKPTILNRSGQNQSVPVPPLRKPSDSDNDLRVKAAVEKKQVSPEEKKKLEYMASLDLVTPDTLKELQSKRSERKRRSTANPQFSYGNFEPERKRGVVSYLSNVMPGTQKRRGRPPKNSSPANSRPCTPSTATGAYKHKNIPVANGTADGDVHEDFCAVCGLSGELLMCDTCNLVYHLQCLDPPLQSIPSGTWSCPKCHALHKQSGNWPGTLELVHSYIAQKAAKEEEKKKLMKRSQELQGERNQLEQKAKQLSNTITKQIQQKSELLVANKNAQQNVDKLKAFVRVFHA